jgi:hypothetical protein
MQVVQVVPQAVGWSVLGCGEPQFFHSGCWAERAGRRLAQALAASGHAVELLIADRSGRLVGRIRLGGADAAAHAPKLEFA